MAFRERHEGFKVEIQVCNERDEMGDRLFSFKIISKEPEAQVYEYCTKILKKSYPKSEKPNLFSPELLEFNNLTNCGNEELGDMYIYRVKCFNTD